MLLRPTFANRSFPLVAVLASLVWISSLKLQNVFAITVPVDDIPQSASRKVFRNPQIVGYGNLDLIQGGGQSTRNKLQNGYGTQYRPIIPMITLVQHEDKPRLSHQQQPQHYNHHQQQQQQHYQQQQQSQDIPRLVAHPKGQYRVIMQSLGYQKRPQPIPFQQQQQQQIYTPQIHPSQNPNLHSYNNNNQRAPLYMSSGSNLRSQYEPQRFGPGLHPKYGPLQPTKIPIHPPSPTSLQVLYEGRKHGQQKAESLPFIRIAGPSNHGLRVQENLQHYNSLETTSNDQVAGKTVLQSELRDHQNALSPQKHSFTRVTPFSPSNKVPGSFRPMISSQKVSHVPMEVFAQAEEDQRETQTVRPGNYIVTPSTPLDVVYRGNQYTDQIENPKLIPHQHGTNEQRRPNDDRKIYHSKIPAAVHPTVHRSPPFDFNRNVNYTPRPRPHPTEPIYITTPKISPTESLNSYLDDNQSISQLLKKLQDSNQLPKTLTPDNIDNSIRTLIRILNDLKETQHSPPDQHLVRPVDPDYKDHQVDYEDDDGPDLPWNDLSNTGDVEQLGANSGTPGVDYPNYFEIPTTQFNCTGQRYKGFFGDPETRCQVWHYCDLNGGQASFLCPNGTIFSQVSLTCDWWFNVKCDTTAQLYVLNERLYKYILPFTPKFPEDYSGPLVDKYLALKFKEMEEKLRKIKGARSNGTELPELSSEEDNDDELGGISSIDQHQAQNIVRQEKSSSATIKPYLTSNPTTTMSAELLNDDDPTTQIPKEYLMTTTTNLADLRGFLKGKEQPVPYVEIISDGNSGHLRQNRDQNSR